MKFDKNPHMPDRPRVKARYTRVTAEDLPVAPGELRVRTPDWASAVTRRCAQLADGDMGVSGPADKRARGSDGGGGQPQEDLEEVGDGELDEGSTDPSQQGSTDSDG